jgi:hypothetical protein
MYFRRRGPHGPQYARLGSDARAYYARLGNYATIKYAGYGSGATNQSTLHLVLPLLTRAKYACGDFLVTAFEGGISTAEEDHNEQVSN